MFENTLNNILKHHTPCNRACFIVKNTNLQLPYFQLIYFLIWHNAKFHKRNSFRMLERLKIYIKKYLLYTYLNFAFKNKFPFNQNYFT